MPQSRVRFVGSRELHRDLPKVLEALRKSWCPICPYNPQQAQGRIDRRGRVLEIIRNPSARDRLLALQLGELVQGLETQSSTAEIEEPQGALVGV